VLASIPKGLPMAKTVLIVDDNALIRQALCEMFKREADFEVCGEAENGREAIEKAQRLHPDLIVMDLSMPVMNGIDAARVLKGMMPFPIRKPKIVPLENAEARQSIFDGLPFSMGV